MRTQRKTKTTKHTSGNLSERAICQTNSRGKLSEFSLNSKMNILFLTHVHLDEEDGKWARSWTSAVTMLA